MPAPAASTIAALSWDKPIRLTRVDVRCLQAQLSAHVCCAPGSSTAVRLVQLDLDLLRWGDRNATVDHDLKPCLMLCQGL
jgi:hypothetical protein